MKEFSIFPHISHLPKLSLFLPSKLSNKALVD